MFKSAGLPESHHYQDNNILMIYYPGNVKLQ